MIDVIDVIDVSDVIDVIDVVDVIDVRVRERVRVYCPKKNVQGYSVARLYQFKEQTKMST